MQTILIYIIGIASIFLMPTQVLTFLGGGALFIIVTTLLGYIVFDKVEGE